MGNDHHGRSSRDGVVARRLFAGCRVAIVAEARKRAVDLAPGAIDATEGPMLRQAAPGVKREIVSKFLLSWRIESLLENLQGRDLLDRRIPLPPCHPRILDRHPTWIAL